MIQIRLVKVGNYLVPQTISCRWNMETCGLGPIKWDRNHKHLKVARRKLARLGLSLTVVRNADIQLHPTSIEASNLGVGEHSTPDHKDRRMNLLAAFTDGQRNPIESAIIAIVIAGWLGGNLIYAVIRELLDGDS